MELLGDLNRGEYVTPQRLTFGAFVRETWLPIVDATKARTTAEMYRRSMEKHVLPRIGGNYVQHLDAARLDRLYLELQAVGPRLVDRVNDRSNNLLGPRLRRTEGHRQAKRCPLKRSASCPQAPTDDLDAPGARLVSRARRGRA